MILILINIVTLMSQRRTLYWNVWRILDILEKVMARILESYYAQMRKIQLFFYYPSDEYISYLMMVDELLFADEIDCRDLFPGDNARERIVVFEIGGI